MKRKFKFRAWVNDIMGEPFEVFDPAFLSQGGTFPRDTIFMQFTGLHDKNGKEIYEGDVVDLYWSFAGATYRCKVFWLTEHARWAMAQDEGKATYNGIFHYFGSQDTKLMDIEVVGNIYENQEPLQP